VIFSETIFWPFYALVFLAVVANSYLYRSVQIQNLIILSASYYFYAQWDWRFLSLILISTILDFVTGKMIRYSTSPKSWLVTSIAINLGILGFFKYFNFFASEAANLLDSIGFYTDISTLNIILPVGISFYTFQTLTYSIDIYRNKIQPTNNFITYATYVAFFPQLVAGPIERASNLLPQFNRIWTYDEHRITSGLRLILFGLFLKIVVADSLAVTVNNIFSDYNQLGGGVLILGSVYFAFQIYGDFCGYSTIAIGIAKLLGYELMTNFRTPYFATSIQDFWRRWHISLSTFFRDYVYIPLGGSRINDSKKYRNLLVTFGLSGLWHGAAWTFIAWGFFHGLLLCIFEALKNLPVPNILNLKSFLSWLVTFSLVCVGWILFRSDSILDALNYINLIMHNPGIPTAHRYAMVYVLMALVVDLLWRKNFRLENSLFSFRYSRILSYFVYTAMFWLIMTKFFVTKSNEFIYFQF